MKYLKGSEIDEKEGKMLCPQLLSFKTYKQKISNMDARIAAANYQQICIDEESRVYKNLKTYSYQEFIKKYICFLPLIWQGRGSMKKVKLTWQDRGA